jgi:hypothetical protein
MRGEGEEGREVINEKAMPSDLLITKQGRYMMTVLLLLKRNRY